MSSRSSSERPGREPLLLGRVSGHRGLSGEITVRVISGRADRWTGLSRVRLGSRGREPAEEREVEGSRAYRDRLVLKLKAVNDATTAAGLRGREVWAPGDELPALAEGEYFQARLVGLEVVDEAGGALGRVTDVLEAGGPALLRVEGPRGAEILVPMAGEIVRRVDERLRRIEVRLPEGLRELNRSEEAQE